MLGLLAAFELITLQCDGIATYGTDRQAGRAQVEIADAVVRVRAPASMAPNVSGRGEDGWRTLDNVEITDTQVTGRYSYNWINRASVRIDRRTGDLEIRAGDIAAGQSHFRGDCRLVSKERMF